MEDRKWNSVVSLNRRFNSCESYEEIYESREADWMVLKLLFEPQSGKVEKSDRTQDASFL